MDADLQFKIRAYKKSMSYLSSQFSCGILTIDELQAQQAMYSRKIRNEVLTYQYQTLGRTKRELPNGQWATYVPDPTKANNRKELRAHSEELLDQKVCSYYSEVLHFDNLTLSNIFEEWLDYKCKRKKNKPETKIQNRASYIKYVKGTPIDVLPLAKIKTTDLEDWAIDVLSTHPMTAKQFNTHKIAVMGPMAYAKRQGYIDVNPWVKEDMEYQQLFDSKRIKSSATMIFYPDEIEDLITEFERSYQNNGNTANLALIANFDLGLRVGELAAIQWSDINWQNQTIYIQRQEDSTKKIDQYVKSDSAAGYRELALSTKVIEIFKAIRNDSQVLSEYVFTHPDGSRKTKTQLQGRLEKAELALKWEYLKRTHCIRRTVASRMYSSNIPLEEIRRWLGHTSLDTTLKYIYNPFREDTTQEMIRQSSILSTNQNYRHLSSKKFDETKNKNSRKAI